MPMASDLGKNRYSFDSTVLPDGHYRFRVEAADRPKDDNPDRLSTTKVSDSIVIDHTAAVLGTVRASNSGLTVVASDALSPLREAVYSVDAADWQDAAVDDGLLDGRRESLSLDIAPASSLVLLRLTDAAFNVITYDLSSNLR